jgi:CRP-like cAMP-binding protein
MCFNLRQVVKTINTLFVHITIFAIMAFEIDKYSFQATIKLNGVSIQESDLFKHFIIIKEVGQDKIIYRQGAYPKGVYVLKKGKIKISQFGPDGKEQIVYIYRRGELFGYRPLLCNQPHPVTATALEDCVIAFIPQKHFLSVLDDSPELVRTLLAQLSHEFMVWLNKINVLGQLPVKERIAVALLILNEKYKKAGKEHLPSVVNLSRENIARFSGTTVESLVRVLRLFKDENIISARGRQITIHNPAALEKLVR